MRKKDFIPVKDFVLFRELFGTAANIHILRGLLSALLNTRSEGLEDILIKNIKTESVEEKEDVCSLDVVVVSGEGRIINLELQTLRCDYYREKCLYVWAKHCEDAVGKLSGILEIPQVSCINIIDFNLFESEKYATFTVFGEVNRKESLSEDVPLSFYELKKLPPVTDENKSDPVLQWLRLINAESEEDLKAIEQSDIPEIIEAIKIVRFFNSDK
jgi:predicted transposase/invertase (TIGR01784 family)